MVVKAPLENKSYSLNWMHEYANNQTVPFQQVKTSFLSK